ncbi:hypothetical protein C8K38_10852 [Rhodococcus sp. OK611]|nr:hypothetical protein [Rhodococcus maanshanensis]MCZ4557863.1 hypothetical protein [Rhodococcus maanshanensis]PTR43181.1 hypothetical protein C8K38_10852 [Rhodococcus sp. OK611]SNX91045.1 hypothetical protein SAMN05447004_10851 [Rhodococcus sp. OK270]
MLIEELNAKLERIGQQPFRAKFQLSGRDRAMVEHRGFATVCAGTQTN